MISPSKSSTLCGFTLIEISIVLTILGVMVGAAAQPA
ncbi:MAG: prepilin-type N-terminal cleavage/methylation domain-containing protein [Pseudolabrys sp.]